MINTRFWNDGYVSELDPMEKLLFLYFLTNSYTNICGVYELPLRVVAFETGIDAEKVRNVLQRFSLDQKIHYEDGWVVVRNFAKHQKQGSPKVAQGIAAELKEIPQHLIGYVYPIDTLSHSNPNPNPNLDSNSKEPHRHLDWLKDIPPDTLKELSEKYEASTSQVKRKGEQFWNYCTSKGKTYKNYRAAIENALDKDFGRRPPKKEVAKTERPSLSAEEQARVQAKKEEIKQLFKAPSI
jgi:hypothetical protein